MTSYIHDYMIYKCAVVTTFLLSVNYSGLAREQTPNSRQSHNWTKCQQCFLFLECSGSVTPSTNFAAVLGKFVFACLPVMWVWCGQCSQLVWQLDVARRSTGWKYSYAFSPTMSAGSKPRIQRILHRKATTTLESYPTGFVSSLTWCPRLYS